MFRQKNLSGFCIWTLPRSARLPVHPSSIDNSLSGAGDYHRKQFSRIVPMNVQAAQLTLLIRSLIQISKKIPEQILCTRRLSLGIFWEIISKNFNKIMYIWFSIIVFWRFEFPFYRQFPHICPNPLFYLFSKPPLLARFFRQIGPMKYQTNTKINSCGKVKITFIEDYKTALHNF